MFHEKIQFKTQFNYLINLKLSINFIIALIGNSSKATIQKVKFYYET